MPNTNFIDTYMPATIELDTQQVLDTRTRLENYVNDSFPELATSPDTVIGDLIISPFSYIIASAELGMDRLLSDLSLENVANGTIYNCEFVENYLNNFGVGTTLTFPATGVLRLIFSKNKDYVLDRGTQFRINNTIFSIYLPNNGHFTCYATDTIFPSGVNGTKLKNTGDDTWFCDVPVLANSGEVNILAGTNAEISQFIPELQSISALREFYPGVQTNSLPTLAKKTQTTIFSASLNTRNGAIQYVNSTCPFVESVFAIKNGDRELLRDYHNQFGVSSGCMDIYARSNQYEFTEKQQVKLVLNADETYFEGWWDYVGQPYHLESITHPSSDLVQLPHEIYSVNDKGLGALAAYTAHEKLYIKVENLLNSEGDRIFQTNVDIDTGEIYTYFTVTYQTDPLLQAIAQTLENEDFRPINTDIMVRGFIPVIIHKFEVVYTKKHGVIPDLDTALDNIKIYLNKVGVPNTYSDAEIARIMGEAGVNYVKKVNVLARVQWSLADYILPYDKEPTIENCIKYKKEPVIRNSDGLRAVFPAITAPITPDLMFACSPRNIRYFTLENSISFTEVRDV